MTFHFRKNVYYIYGRNLISLFFKRKLSAWVCIAKLRLFLIIILYCVVWHHMVLFGQFQVWFTKHLKAKSMVSQKLNLSFKCFYYIPDFMLYKLLCSCRGRLWLVEMCSFWLMGFMLCCSNIVLLVNCSQYNVARE